MSDEELIEKALSPEAAKHWQWAKSRRERFNEEGCICYVCKSIPGILAVFREHTAPTEDDLPRCGYCGDGPDLPSCPAHGTYGYLKSDNSDESGIRRGVPAEPAVTEPASISLHAQRGGKTQELIDGILAQANEGGIRVEVIYPQREVTEEMVDAALDARRAHEYVYATEKCPCGEGWSVAHKMRAALEAALSTERSE